MKNVFGFVGILIVAALGAYIYSKQATSLSPGGAAGNPRQTIDLIGVQNDLIAIGNAERRHFAAESKYVSIDDLISAGDLSMSQKKRGPFEYTSDVGSNSFRITATYTGNPQPGIPQTMSIDESMQISKQ